MNISTGSWTSQVVDANNSGHIIRTYPDGSVYMGAIDENQLFTGYGQYINQFGHQYCGEFLAGKKHGSCIEITWEGARFEGAYFNNLKHGLCRESYIHGYFQGTYVYGLRQGPGIVETIEYKDSEGRYVSHDLATDNDVCVKRVATYDYINGELVREPGLNVHETLYDDGFMSLNISNLHESIGPGPYHDNYPEDHSLPYYENMSEEDWV